MDFFHQLGQLAYEAYGQSVGNLNFLGKPMPKYDELPEPITDAWAAAAKAIYVHTLTLENGEF